MRPYLHVTPWRNGSASDSRSEGCVFKSRRGHLPFFIQKQENFPPFYKVFERKLLVIIILFHFLFCVKDVCALGLYA